MKKDKIRFFFLDSGILEIDKKGSVPAKNDSASKRVCTQYDFEGEELFGIFSQVFVRIAVDHQSSVIELKGNFAEKSAFDFLAKKIFGILGTDSNGLSKQQLPVYDTFGGEFYYWCVDFQGNVVGENENIEFDLMINRNGTQVSLTIGDAQNLFGLRWSRFKLTVFGE